MSRTVSKPDTAENTVSAAEFVRNFARFREVALQNAVFISNHGRVSHVLSSVEEFDRTQSVGAIAADVPLRQATLFGLADWVNEAVIVCNPDEEVIYANRVAVAICGMDLPSDRAVSLRTAMPRMLGSLMEVNFRRSALSREPTTADIPSPFVAGNWLNLRIFPLRENTVMLLRDITEEVQRHRLADVKKAMIDVFALHGGMGYVRLTVRGTMERVGEAFCNWVGLTEDKLLGVPLLNLIDRADRANFREGMEGVLGGTGTFRTVTRLTPNRSGVVAVDCAMVHLQGAYGAEGAVAVFTRHDRPTAE